MDKIYYMLEMTSISPLRIGGGGNEETDSDILLDGRGTPFIPGSSLSGVLRSLCENEEDKNELFGSVINATETSNAEAFSSKILIGDGVLERNEKTGNILITRRDGIGLDDWGMTIIGAKYDFQIAEVDSPFISLIECNFDSDSQREKFDKIINQVINEGINLGARTTRGYGKVACKAKRRIFTFPRDINLWLEFNAYSKDAFESEEFICKKKSIESKNTLIEISANILGNISIRVNEANAVVREDGTNPDNVTLKNKDENPVIPGTSWAGSFRHHMIQINKEIPNSSITNEAINLAFGKGHSGGDSTKSLISFSESVIYGGKPVTTMRNSVDRFTAAPTNGHLFTTESWNGGSTKLCISFPKDKLGNQFKQLVSLSIIDLHHGLMTVGGGAGVGKGIMEIEKITVDGIDKTEDLANYSFNI